MAGVTDRAFRRICHELGCSYTISEMISAKAIHYQDEKTACLACITPQEGPTAIQLFGSEPEILAEAAEKISLGQYAGCKSTASPVAIDLNMGCPMKKIVSNGEGSALMKDPDKIYRIVSAVCSAVDLPVTVKMRTGWDEYSKNAPECAAAAVFAGASMITVHGRTKEQLYRPPIDLETIAAVKKAVGSIPVIGNGGITCAQEAEEMLQKTGCDGVMIGQGAQGNPWIFREITARMLKKEPPVLTLSEKQATILRHLSYLVQDKGELLAVREARHHLAAYVHGMRGATTFRNEINKIEEYSQLVARIQQLFEENEEKSQLKS